MALEYYICCGQKRLRCGYTTGTCAALAAKAAVKLLLTGAAEKTETLMTPKGITVTVDIAESSFDGKTAACSVLKDGGDDWDATDGTPVFAAVTKTEGGFSLDGGKGVGRVTRPGLEQPVGAAAINRVPREMIEREATAAARELGYSGGLSVVISVPEGEAIAAKTFNPVLGIEGGISVLGTSGIVEPQSVQALIDSICLELSVLAAEGKKDIIITPGNYGEDFIASVPALRGRPVVQCSNYIGEAIDAAARDGFERVLFVGHIGKFVKLAGGVMNTHSHNADCRCEIITAHAALFGLDEKTAAALMSAMTTDGCFDILEEAGLIDKVTDSLLKKIQYHIERRAAGAFSAGAVIFSNKRGLIGKSAEAQKILEDWGADF